MYAACLEMPLFTVGRSQCSHNWRLLRLKWSSYINPTPSPSHMAGGRKGGKNAKAWACGRALWRVIWHGVTDAFRNSQKCGHLHMAHTKSRQWKSWHRWEVSLGSTCSQGAAGNRQPLGEGVLWFVFSFWLCSVEGYGHWKVAHTHAVFEVSGKEEKEEKDNDDMKGGRKGDLGWSYGMGMEMDVLKIHCVYEIVKEQVRNGNSKPQKITSKQILVTAGSGK